MPALVRHPHAALLEPTQLLLQLANKQTKYQLLQAIQKPCRPWSDIHMLLCWNLHSSCFNWQINKPNISYCRPSRNHAGPGPSTCCSAGTYQLLLQLANKQSKYQLLQAIQKPCRPWSDIHMLLCWNLHSSCFNWQINKQISVIAGHPETMPALVRHPHAALLEPTQLLLQLANKHSKYQLLQAIQKPCRPCPTQLLLQLAPETMVRHPHAALLEPGQLLLQLANKHSKYQLLQAIQKPCRPWSDIHMLLCWNLHSSCFNWQINTANISYCRPSRNHAGPGQTSTCNLHSSCFNWQINTANISYCRPSRNHAGPGPTSTCCSAGTYTAPASTGK